MKTLEDFFHSLPKKIQPEAIEGLATNFHFSFKDTKAYTVIVKDGVCSVNEGLEGDPECVVSGDSEEFQKIINGQLNPMMALMMGKIKVSNTGKMMKYAKIFGVL